MADDLDEEIERIQRDKVTPVLPAVGIAVGFMPFMVSYRETHTESILVTQNGAEIQNVTKKHAFDYVAAPLGAVAFVLGFVGLVRGFIVRKRDVIGVGLAAAALGVIQIVRAFLP